jgi:phosphoribosylanthranilate isomerase
MKIKVCGMKHPENIQALAGLSPDLMGFIFYDRSPRCATGLQTEVLNDLPLSIIKTAVFVNEDEETIQAIIDRYQINAVQLHGSESPSFCQKFFGRVTVIKAFGIDEGFDFGQLNAYAGQVDYFLFDTKTAAHGGSGKTFDWAILDQYKLDVPFFISGGLSYDNLEKVKQIKHPAFYGVDLNSRFETEPGRKDISKLQQAFKLLRDTHEIYS